MREKLYAFFIITGFSDLILQQTSKKKTKNNYLPNTMLLFPGKMKWQKVTVTFIFSFFWANKCSQCSHSELVNKSSCDTYTKIRPHYHIFSSKQWSMCFSFRNTLKNISTNNPNKHYFYSLESWIQSWIQTNGELNFTDLLTEGMQYSPGWQLALNFQQ